MTRITDKDITLLIDQLNDLTGNPKEPYTFNANAPSTANVGNYHASQAYGGWCLHQTSNQSGGIRCPLMQGHIKKRDFYNELRAFIVGVVLQQEHNVVQGVLA